jgi:uncharacterized protein YecT (DUF1311 family)
MVNSKLLTFCRYNWFAFGLDICCNDRMQRGCGISLSWLLAALVVVSNDLFAGSQNIELNQADAELNGLYQQLMNSLSADKRERLRTAERAWISFREKNNAAFQATSEKGGLSRSQLAESYVGETHARCDQLRRILSGGSWGKTELREVQSEDAELNHVYKQALAVLSSAEETRLREAQRAWLDFYNASNFAGAELAVLIISQRTEQLRAFYLEKGAPLDTSSGNTENPERSDTEEAKDPTIPDPFERARVSHSPP